MTDGPGTPVGDPWASYDWRIAPPPPEAGTEGFAIASLVLGIIPVCAGVLGIVFGFVALSRIKKSGQRGRGLAVAGISCSVAWIVIGIAALVLAAALDDSGTRDAEGRITEASSISVSKLRIGDCVADLPRGRVLEVDAVPCDDHHTAEVFDTYTMPAGPFPGESAVRASADRHCSAEIDDYVGAPEGQSGYAVFLLNPVQDTWSDERRVACLLTNPDHTYLYAAVRGEGPRPESSPSPMLAPGDVTGAVSPADLVVGNCITTRFPDGTIVTVDLSPCAKPHLYEVFSVYSLPAGPYPGERQTDALVLGHCRKYLPGFLRAPAGRSGYRIEYFFPRATDWAADDRAGTCMLTAPGARPLTREAKGRGPYRS
jgi:hypothetical protein